MAKTNGWKVTVGTSSTPVAPAQSGFTAVVAANATAYAAGSYVTMPNGRTYWTPNGGTYTTVNAPTHTIGAETSSDSIIWVCIRGSRDYVVISSDIDKTVFLMENGPAIATGGVVLDAYRPWIKSFSNGSQTAIVASGSATLHVMDV